MSARNGPPREPDACDGHNIMPQVEPKPRCGRVDILVEKELHTGTVVRQFGQRSGCPCHGRAAELADGQALDRSRMCFVCGIENPIGLNLKFYTDDEGRCIARFRPKPEHQGCPGQLHGGLISTLLDEPTQTTFSYRVR